MRSLGRSAIACILAAFAMACALIALPAPAQAAESSSLATAALDDVLIAAPLAEPQVSYRMHVRGGSWQGWVGQGAKAKVSGVADAIKVKVEGGLPGSVQYQAYIHGKGWQAVKADGKNAGKQGASYGVEAVRMALAGDLSKSYDIQYRVRAKKGSWQTWTDGGSIAGEAGSGVCLNALKVRLVKKETASSDEGEGLVGVRYRARLKGSSWQAWTQDNATAGAKGKKDRIYKFALALDAGALEGGISYRLQPTGGQWEGWREGGTSAKSKAGYEAIRIKLSGQIAKRYDVVYRVNIEGIGWQKRVRNGEEAGVSGGGARIRAIRVQLVEKSARAGWVKSDSAWSFYKKGKAVKSRWVTTSESPIDVTAGSAAGKRRYWIDASGHLAVDRAIDPSNTADAKAKIVAFATGDGTLLANDLKMIGGTWYSADAEGAMTKWKGKKADLVKRYVNWAKAIAADDSHGYSQANRWGPDYDCSSLVVASLAGAGFEVGDALWTGNLKSELTKHGFSWKTDLSKLKSGDILLVHNSSRQHTEIYIGGGKTVGAHSSETGGIYGLAGDQTGKEISVDKYYDIWQGYLRYTG